MLNFILILVYIAVGYGLKQLSFNTVKLADYLNKFVIYLALPAMILLEIPKLQLDEGWFVPLVISWSVMGLSAFLVFFLARWLRFTKEVTGALLLVAVLTNSSFVGIPIISAYFGAVSLPYIIIYDQLGTFLALSTYGTMVIALYSTKSDISFKIIVQKIVLFPPFLTFVFAVLLREVAFSQVLLDVLQVLAATIVPFALLAVGLQMQLILPKEEIKPFSLALIIKLLISPMVAMALCAVFAWEGLAAQVSIMEAGMPPMITAAVMASFVGLAPRLSSAIVGYGILLSFVTSYVLYLMI